MLIILGFLTRPVASRGRYGIRLFHQPFFPRNFFPMLNGGDAAIVYCFIYLYLRRPVEAPGAWTLGVASGLPGASRGTGCVERQ